MNSRKILAASYPADNNLLDTETFREIEKFVAGKSVTQPNSFRILQERFGLAMDSNATEKQKAEAA